MTPDQQEEFRRHLNRSLFWFQQLTTFAVTLLWCRLVPMEATVNIIALVLGLAVNITLVPIAARWTFAVVLQSYYGKPDDSL